VTQGKATTILGALSLGAAVALLAAACVGGGTPAVRHTAAHPMVPAGTSAALPAPSPPAPAGASSSLPADPSALPAPPARSCKATLELVETWPGGYRATATITNTADTPLGGWYIQWVLPKGATITQAWNGTHMQSGPIAMIHALGDDESVLAPGATAADIGFVGAARTPPTFTEITCG
jgi:mannan endo-1,4-beta-mannosidase